MPKWTKRIKTVSIPNDPYRKAGRDHRNSECRIYDKDGKLKRVIPKGKNQVPGWNSQWNTVK